jgi:predicted Zn-dependent protease with MMP-like domain
MVLLPAPAGPSMATTTRFGLFRPRLRITSGMSPHEFDGLVAEAYARIPARFRKRMKNVALIVEAGAGPAQLARGRVPRWEHLAGLYEGRPLTCSKERVRAVRHAR